MKEARAIEELQGLRLQIDEFENARYWGVFLSCIFYLLFYVLIVPDKQVARVPRKPSWLQSMFFAEGESRAGILSTSYCLCECAT